MPSERLFLFWGLIPLVVSLIAARLGGGESRMDRFLLGGSLILLSLLFYFTPRLTIAPGIAAVATLVFSGVVALLYLTLSAPARRPTSALLGVLAVVDIAALVVVHLSVVACLGTLASSVLVLAVAAGAGLGAVWAVRRIGRAGDGSR